MPAELQHVALVGRDHPGLLKSTTVMALLGYSDRSAFWEFVKRAGVPHIRLNARRIMFDPVALSAWLRRRST